MLRRNPGFTIIAVLTLALGIGATSSVFSLIHGVLLIPPPYSHPERLVLLTPERVDGRSYIQGWSAFQWTQWQKEVRSFEAMAGYHWEFDFLCLSDRIEPVSGLVTTASYFQVTGLRPLLGRMFLASEGYKDPVMIIGHELWQRQFNSDPHIVGKSIHLSRSDWADIGSRTIVGVMPPRVRFLPSPTDAEYPGYDINERVDYWIPAQVDLSNAKQDYYNVVGRLRPGATTAQAQAELKVITGRQARTDRDFEGLSARVDSLQMELNRAGNRLLLPLFGAVALVFLIACGNVAGLLLARGLQRQHEYSIRCALGATRWQIFRHVFAENLLLALFGGGLGAGLAVLMVNVLKVSARAAVTRLDAVTIGWPVLGFCIGSAAAASLLAGIVPALRASRLDTTAALKGGGRISSTGFSDRRLLSGLAIVQTALTLGLLIGAGLMIRTVINLAHVHLGYETQNILSMSVTQVRYAQQSTGMKDDKAWVSRFIDFHRRAVSQVAALPGVQNAAWAWGVPLTGNKWVGSMSIDGQPQGLGLAEKLGISMRSVSPEYFDTVGLPLLEGRNFRTKEAFDWPRLSGATNEAFAVLINQAMAERHFSGRNPVGHNLHFSFENVHAEANIIGIVANSHDEALSQQAAPGLYFSFWQLPPGTKHLVVRAVSNPRSVIANVERELRRVDPGVVVQDVKTFEQIRSGSIAPQLFAMRLLTGFSFLASAVAVTGIYGVLSLSVASRRREFAIRAALGAQRRAILSLVIGFGLRIVGIGVVLGMGVALVLMGSFRGLLFGVSPTDLPAFAGAAMLFTGVALVACSIPARRAANANPMAALRDE